MIYRKHLIVSIGSECYVTLPKGQIVPTHSASDHPKAKIPKVPGGGHVLIVPITHYPTYATIPDDLAQPILEETNKCASFPLFLFRVQDSNRDSWTMAVLTDINLPYVHFTPNITLTLTPSRLVGSQPKADMHIFKSYLSRHLFPLPPSSIHLPRKVNA